MKRHPEYWYVLFIPGYIVSFFLVERLVPSSADYWVSYCRLDDYIPFLEGFIVPYCLWYPLLAAVGFPLMFLDVPELKRYMRFLIIGCAFSLLFCLVFPNGQDLRPAVFPRENVFTMLVARIYASDTNTNVLPSMHVIGSVAACIGAWHSRALRRWFPLVLVVAVLIILSTVFVKQHSILDIFAGLLVCLPLWWLIYGRKPRRKKNASDSQEVTK